MSQPSTVYDALPYSNNAFTSTHPNTLATVALLYGHDAPDIRSARVLELGCGRGGNLLPMAEVLPESEFLGIDLSSKQIEDGQGAIETLGLTNVRLQTLSICDVPEDIGNFDYIMAHGVYSWVPDEVREKTLEVCSKHLSPNGVAYISYNTYPGWHYRGVAGDFLRFHVDRTEAPGQQLQRAREGLAFGYHCVADKEGKRSGIFQEELKELQECEDTYLFHEHLEPDSRPFYFHEFMAQASKYELQYLDEAKVDPLLATLQPTVFDVLPRWTTDRVRQEQYLDFLIHRTFRRTLLCRVDVSLSEKMAPEGLRACHFTSAARPTVAVASVPREEAIPFETPSKVSMSVGHPLVQCMLMVLHESSPMSLSFDELAIATARKLQQNPDEAMSTQLGDALVACYDRSAVEIDRYPATWFNEVSERPCASPIARLQAQGDSRVTTRRHRGIELDPMDRFLLCHLDGTRDRETLVNLLAQCVQSGQIAIKNEQGEALPTEAVDEFCRGQLESRLTGLARRALLIG